MIGSAILLLYKVQVAVRQPAAISVIAVVADDFYVPHYVPLLCGNDIRPVLRCDAVTRRQSRAANILQSNEPTDVDTRNMGDDAANSTSIADVSSNPTIGKPDAISTAIHEPEMLSDNDKLLMKT